MIAFLQHFIKKPKYDAMRLFDSDFTNKKWDSHLAICFNILGFNNLNIQLISWPVIGVKDVTYLFHSKAGNIYTKQKIFILFI